LTPEPPEDVVASAERRSAARAKRDFATADQLRAQIEDAGWKVIDSGVGYRLTAAHPPTVEAGGETRYGRSSDVPSRLDEPASRLATVVVVSREDRQGAVDTARAVLATTSEAAQVVLVVDGPEAAPDLDVVRDLLLAAAPGADDRLELVQTTAVLGQGAALNAGIRRAVGEAVILVDASVTPTGEWVAPLVAALEEPAVALAGPFGLASADLRHFEEVARGPAAAIEGYVQAFRRSDFVARGPLDEGFRFYRNLDVWWSLVLRDEGPGRPPRRAAVVPGLPLQRNEPAAWTGTSPAERDRLSKRNFYRLLERFRSRLDLAVPPG